MGNYIYLNKISNKNDLAISKKVFVTIGEEAIKDIKGIIKKKEKEEKIKPSVIVNIHNNKVSYKFNLLLDKDISQEIIKEEISRNVNINLLNQCDAVPFDISFNFTNK